MTEKPLNTFQQEEEEGFKLADFGMVLLSHWMWIALSVAIALGAASFMVLRTTPTYTRSSMLLIKSDEKGGTSGAGSLPQEFQNLGLVGSNSNINNEILTLSAPVLMQEAVKRLSLDVQMSVENGLHRIPLYDNAPIRLFMPNAKDEDFASFRMKIKKDRTAELWDFSSGSGKADARRISVKMNTLARTPVGDVVIQPTEHWDTNFTNAEVYVTKLPLSAVSAGYKARFSVALSNKESSILELKMTDESKQRADHLILKIVEVYNEQWLKDRNRVAETTYEFITDRLNTLSKELGDVDQQISDYKSSALLPDVDAASNMYMAESTRNTDQIISLNNQLSVARYIREYLGDSSKQDQYLPTNTGIGSMGVERMIEEYNRAMSTRNDMVENSSENAPLVQKFNNEMAMQRSAIMHSLDNLIAQLQSQLKNWELTENATNRKLAAAPQQVKQLLSVGRQQKVKESLYIYLLQKREENELSKTFTAWNTRVIQPPMGSNAPSSPRKSMILLVALAVGLAVPVGLLYLREVLNNTVRGRADVDGMQIPLLAEIPAMIQKKHWWQRSQRNAACQVYVEANNRDLLNESFRILRTKLDYYCSSYGEETKVIMLTSFNPGSGKSFISANLAKVLSLNGKRVLAVDMDLRHCSLSQVIGKPKVGLSAYLGGMTDNVDELIQRNAIGDGADVLPVGVIPPNPAEMLLSNKLEDFFATLRKEYDYIILDCPPIEIVADTNIVKKYADVSLFVVRAGLMDRRCLKDVDELYSTQSYKHMALLLNGTTYVSSRYGSYRYGYGYGYSYGYAYGYGYGEDRKKK